MSGKPGKPAYRTDWRCTTCGHVVSLPEGTEPVKLHHSRVYGPGESEPEPEMHDGPWVRV